MKKCSLFLKSSENITAVHSVYNLCIVNTYTLGVSPIEITLESVDVYFAEKWSKTTKCRKLIQTFYVRLTALIMSFQNT